MPPAPAPAPAPAAKLQLSPACDARPLLVPSEDDVLSEIQRVSQGVLRATMKGQRKEYYKQARLRVRRSDHRIVFGFGCGRCVRGRCCELAWRHHTIVTLPAEYEQQQKAWRGGETSPPAVAWRLTNPPHLAPPFPPFFLLGGRPSWRAAPRAAASRPAPPRHPRRTPAGPGRAQVAAGVRPPARCLRLYPVGGCAFGVTAWAVGDPHARVGWFI